MFGRSGEAMTLDRLLEEFKSAVERQPWSSAAGYDARRAGIRAVVEALRDEISMNCTLDDDYSVYRWMDKILASDGVKSGGSE